MSFSYAQKRCGAMERLQFEIAEDQSIETQRTLLNKQIKQWKSSRANEAYTIPVVFHVLYENVNENIGIDQIQSQLDVLNQDFNRTNNDANQTPNEFAAIAANCNISFCLAQRTPNNDTTSGVTYTQTSVTSFSLYDNRIFYDSLGGKNIWDSKKYLNIYVCDLTNALGFAAFPGGNDARDAVVIDFEHFGTINVSPPFNKGRTATHEVGHWLNLLHIWGDGNCGSDQVDDTPTQQAANYNCPSHPSPTCENNGDMFQNFMDYTNDACMNLFTLGQKNRMHATLNIDRIEATNLSFCQLPFEDIGIIDNVSPQNNQEYCGQEIEITTTLFNYSEKVISSATINYFINDQAPQSIEWNGILNPNSSANIDLGNLFLNPGEHSLTIFSKMPNDFRDLNPNNDTLNVSFLVKSGTNYEIAIQTDNYAEETSWQIQNSAGQIISYSEDLMSNTLNTFDYCQDLDSCHTLFIIDEYNDGICCDFGNGYIQINQQLFSGSFNSQVEIDLCSISSISDFDKNGDISIYPNPTLGKLTVSSTKFDIRQIIVFDIFGKNVFQKGCHNKEEELNLYYLESGLYLIQVDNGITSRNLKFFKR